MCSDVIERRLLMLDDSIYSNWLGISVALTGQKHVFVVECIVEGSGVVHGRGQYIRLDHTRVHIICYSGSIGV
jgi:hypothetical protein